MASKITRAARGQGCALQIYPYCNENTETTVFCHAPSEEKGISRKSPDWWGAFGCSNCHDVVDGRRKTDLSQHEIQSCFMRGIFRTQKKLIEMGVIKVG